MLIWVMDTKLKKQLEQNVKQHKTLYIFNGAVFIIFGIIAFIAPMVAAEFLDILIGSLLLIMGLFQASVSYATKRHWTYYLSAIVSVLAGSLMIAKPMNGVLALAAIIAIFLLLQGFIQIFTASLYAPFKGWGWTLVSGVISITLAGLVYSGWPVTGVWFLGILVGFNFISFGASMIALTNFISNS
jgi:uncharacterized membrane protein HdeD (DUF308 family)